MTKKHNNSSSESEAESKPRRSAAREKSAKANTSDNDEPAKSKRAKNASKRAEKKDSSSSEHRGTKIDKIARLHVPANKIKKQMLAYWKVKGCTKLPSLRDQIHIYMASIIEDVTVMLAKSAVAHSKKNSMGLYTITDTNINMAIRESDDLRNLFLLALCKYDKDTDYMSGSILTGDDLAYVLTSLDDEYQFGEHGQNLACYLINSFFNLLMKGIRGAKDWMAPKGVSVQARMMDAVLDGHLNSTELKPMRKIAKTRLRRVEEYNLQNREEAAKKKEDEDSDEEEDEDEDEDEDDEDDSSSKKSKDKKKRSSKKSDDDTSEDEKPAARKAKGKGKRIEESESDVDNSADDDDESEEEEPVKKNKKNSNKRSNSSD
jgi:hypothetical protein